MKYREYVPRYRKLDRDERSSLLTQSSSDEVKKFYRIGSLRGPQEQDSLLPIFFKSPPKGAFFAAISLAPSLLRVSWLHLRKRKRGC
jgi:hypothetical protein